MGDVIKVDFSKKQESTDQSFNDRAKRIEESIKRINFLMSELEPRESIDYVRPETEQ
jgi:hypothetical protein